MRRALDTVGMWAVTALIIVVSFVVVNWLTGVIPFPFATTAQAHQRPWLTMHRANLAAQTWARSDLRDPTNYFHRYEVVYLHRRSRTSVDAQVREYDAGPTLGDPAWSDAFFNLVARLTHHRVRAAGD